MLSLKSCLSVSQIKLITTVISLIFCFFLSNRANALTINVVDTNGNPVAGFRYLLEEDTSHFVSPGLSVSNSLSVGIHRSYNPTVLLNNGNPAEGHIIGSSAKIDNDNGRRYILSILPDSGYTNGGAHIDINQDIVSVTVNPKPVPVAQISVLVFQDTSPINSIPDLPREKGLQGFSIFVSDAAGQMFYDVFGNLLGTEYQKDGLGNVVLDPDGAPIIRTPGTGAIVSDEKGEAIIKNLAPGKYGVHVVPPRAQNWVQTNTMI